MKHLLALLVVVVLVTSSLAQSGGLINGTRGIPYPNDSTGTTLWGTAIITTAGAAETAPATPTGPVRIVVGGAGTSGNAVLASAGTLAPCTMDAAVTSGGNFFVIAGAAGQCHPQSAAPTAGAWVIGYLHDPTTTVGGQSLVHVNGFFYGGAGGSGSGTVSSSATAGPLTYYAAAGTTVSPMTSASVSTTGSGINLGLGTLQFGTTTTATDLGIQRASIGLVVLTNGTTGGENSYLRSANTFASTTAGAFSASVPGANGTCCQRSLPAGTRTWAIHCVIPFGFTSGSGATNVTVGVTLNQVPTLQTYFTGVLWGGTAPTYQAALLSATSGATPILNAVSLTIDTTTIYSVVIDGVVSNNASNATTVAPYFTTSAGAGETKPGAYCRYE